MFVTGTFYVMTTALRNWRQANNLTILQLAQRLGVSGPSLSKVERGKQWPDREFFERVHVATNGEVTANDFCTLADTGEVQ